MNSDRMITIKELLTLNYDLIDIYAERQKWKDGSIFIKDSFRKSTGIIFLNGCTGEYKNLKEESFEAFCKSLICLPYKSRYKVFNKTSNLEYPDAYLVEFNIVIDNKIATFSYDPFLITDFNQYYVKELLDNIVKEYESLVKSPAKLKSLIYKLLGYLGEESSIAHNKKCLPISPAIDYMTKNPISSIQVNELAKMCCISEGYFRRLFHEYTGKSPMKHILDVKIENAKKLLENSNTSVERIAEMLDFESSSYFCKVFKKKTKKTPSQFRENL